MVSYQSAKDEIKRAADVVELIGQYVKLKKTGRNWYSVVIRGGSGQLFWSTAREVTVGRYPDRPGFGIPFEHGAVFLERYFR